MSKQRSESLSRRPNDSHGLLFSQTKFHCELSDNTRRVSDVHCGEGGQTSEHIMSSVVWKKGIEEPCASEGVARFINSLGYKEITLRSDTEPAILASRNRVAENCKAEVALEDAVKGDKRSNGLVENAVMMLRGVIRTIKCHVESCTQEELREDSPDLAVVGGTCGEHFVQMPEGSRRSDAIRKIAWKDAYTIICAIRREGAGETDFIRTVEQNESQMQVRSVAGSEKQQC